MNAAQDLDWVIVGALIAPPIVWTACNIVQLLRARRKMLRLMRETKGDGLP